jgi:hypothetical protein
MVRHLWRAAVGSTLLVVCLTLLSSQSFGQGVGTGAGLGGETEGHMGVDVVTNPDDWVDRHGDNLHL